MAIWERALNGEVSRGKGPVAKRASLSLPRGGCHGPWGGGSHVCQCLDLAASPSVVDDTSPAAQLAPRHDGGRIELIWRGTVVPNGQDGVPLGGEAAWAFAGRFLGAADKARHPGLIDCKHRGRGGVIPISTQVEGWPIDEPVRTVTVMSNETNREWFISIRSPFVEGRAESCYQRLEPTDPTARDDISTSSGDGLNWEVWLGKNPWGDQSNERN